MHIDVPDSIRVSSLLPADSYASDSTHNGSALSVGDLEDRAVITWDSEASGGATGTADLTFQHRADSTDDWGSVPAAALQELDSDTADTFTQVTNAAAAFQSLALDLRLCKAQIRAVLTTVNEAVVCSVTLAGLKKYA